MIIQLSLPLPCLIILIFSLFFLLLSNALNSRRDRSIFYSRITILILISSIILANNALYASFMDNGMGLYGGLFHCTALTLNFYVFIFLISAFCLQLTSFYPRNREVYPKHLDLKSVLDLFYSKFSYYKLPKSHSFVISPLQGKVLYAVGVLSLTIYIDSNYIDIIYSIQNALSSLSAYSWNNLIADFTGSITSSSGSITSNSGSINIQSVPSHDFRIVDFSRIHNSLHNSTSSFNTSSPYYGFNRGCILLSHNTSIFNLSFIFTYKAYFIVLLAPLFPLMSSIVSSFFATSSNLFLSNIKLSNFVKNKTKTVSSNLVSSIPKLPQFLLNKTKTIFAGFRYIRVNMFHNSQTNASLHDFLNYSLSDRLAHLSTALFAHTLDLRSIILKISGEIGELKNLIEEIKRKFGIIVLIENGIATYDLPEGLTEFDVLNIKNRITYLDQMASRIQGYFVDMIRSMAAMMQLVKFIQKITPEYSYDLLSYLNQIYGLIRDSLGLYTAQDFNEVLQETLNELSSDSSPRDFSNLHDDISSREDWFCKRFTHRYGYVNNGPYEAGEPSSCGMNIGLNGTHKWYDSHTHVTGEHGCCYCNQDFSESDPRMRCQMCKCTLHTKCYSDLYRK